MTEMTSTLIAQELPPPTNPLAVARAIADQYGQDICWQQGTYYSHAGPHWQEENAEAIRGWLYRVTEYAYHVTKDDKGEEKMVAWAPTRKKIADLEEALSHGVLQHLGDVEYGLFFSNGYRGDDGILQPHSPKRFNLTSLPFAYDPDATAPEWQKFLDSSLPGEVLAQHFLQEWFGYVLSGRTDLQMMASLVGASRSGKGVIVRVLEAMLGTGNSTGVTLNDLAGDYGLSGLIGKTLATISEPKWASRAAGEVVEPLLRITGNDTVRANRKYAKEWVGRLGVRFMILSNETPRLINRSGALANRMTHIKFGVSFAGREDIGLEDRLMAELPGIMNWALAGLERLKANGRFTAPESHDTVNAKFREYADPDADFLDNYCVQEAGEMVDQFQLFKAYGAWTEEMGRTKDSTDVTSLRQRLTDRPGIADKRIGKAKVWHLLGLRLSEKGAAAVHGAF